MGGIGKTTLAKLVSRSLIHRRLDDGKASFEMQDLILDLATMVSYPYCIMLDEEELHERVRHLSFNRGKYDSYNKFKKLYGLKGLRTFLALPLQVSSHSCSLSNKVVRDFLPRMKQLRVLSMLNYINITELPDSIGNLIYLRYLNLSYTGIERLPSATCKLYNLQSLLLFHCGNRFMRMEMSLLPSSLMSLHIYQLDDIECLEGKWLHHLTSLKDLEISYAPKLKSLPEQGFPSSLSVVNISDCPLLEETWRTKKGKEWRKIARIPCILINYKMIS